MIFLYEYIPTVLTIPTAYCMENGVLRELMELRLELGCAEKIISGVRHSGYHVMRIESMLEQRKSRK
jgi:hypothetical protein